MELLRVTTISPPFQVIPHNPLIQWSSRRFRHASWAPGVGMGLAKIGTSGPFEENSVRLRPFQERQTI